MRRVRIEEAARPGAILARDVRLASGETAARAGAALSERTAGVLRERGVGWCFIDDEAGRGLDVTPLDGEAAGVRAVVASLQARVAAVAQPLRQLSTPRILHLLRETQPAAPLRHAPPFLVLREAAKDLAQRAATVSPQGGYVVSRTAADDDAGHAVAVAALTSRIAALVGLDAEAVTDATMAALLHDAGMAFVPDAVRRKPERDRSAPEQRRYEDHATLGAALLAPLAEGALDLAIVAGEHHEAQDGTGFPGGIGGGNRVLRTADARRDAGRIALMSEVVAVADRYERLLSPAAGWPGCGAAEARLLLAREAGTMLNREVVTRFLGSFPELPVGTEVAVTVGAHAGAEGLVRVAAPPPGARCVVRLLRDAEGRAVPPVEVPLPAASVAAVAGRAVVAGAVTR
ncbi:MAG: HD domain-containing phosphohydrolase [Dehalococcoidia bacterium]